MFPSAALEAGTPRQDTRGNFSIKEGVQSCIFSLHYISTVLTQKVADFLKVFRKSAAFCMVAQKSCARFVENNNGQKRHW
jgi:hypothetical protein